MAITRLKPTREQIVQYIEATLLKGYTKKDAYTTYIDDSVKNPSAAVVAFEKRKDFQEIHQVLSADDNMKLQEQVRRVKQKYASLVEKNIDTMDGLLDDAKKSDSAKQKAATVRLANETISALAVVSGGDAGQPAKQIDASSVVS